MDSHLIHNRHIPSGAKLVERNGYVFIAHPRYRFDPVITPLAIGVVGVGTVQGIMNTRQEGKDAKKLADQRAAIDEANAEAARTASVEKAKITGERGQRLLATQKSEFAAGNVRINVGAPLVIETETRDVIARDVGFVLEFGRAESDFLRSSAAIERATGKVAKRQSRFSAIAQGLEGFGSIALLSRKAGLFSKKPPPPGTVLPDQRVRRLTA